MLTAWWILSVSTAPADSQPSPIQHLVFHSWWNLISGGAWLFSFPNFTEGRRQGRAFPLPEQLQGNHTIGLPLFSTWTTLHCSPSGRCSLVPQLYAGGPRSQWEQRQRETESERRRMESMNLWEKHNWDIKPGLTCTSWTADTLTQVRSAFSGSSGYLCPNQNVYDFHALEKFLTIETLTSLW